MLVVMLGNCASTFAMVGLIWFVQIVHYPLFARIDSRSFKSYQVSHMRLTGRVVAPAMIVEAVTSLLLVWQPPFPALEPYCWAGLALLAIIWLSTFLLQVPRHEELCSGFTPAAHRTLLRTNWIRTCCWSLRGALVLYLLSRSVSLPPAETPEPMNLR
jgi:uncharacterized membrane protein